MTLPSFIAQNISTHTPAWGVTALQYRMGAHTSISTHTPAWGVTFPAVCLRRCDNHFNSHARVGRDISDPVRCPAFQNFNSHARVGRDWLHHLHHTIFSYFNSHARVGRDGKTWQQREELHISTHTPAWGVTVSFLYFFLQILFQLTRPRGA